jgi:chemotaxis protein histidine kinase CheA
LTDPVETRLRELSAAYGRRILERVQAVRAGWSEVRRRGRAAPGASDLKRLLHSLKGTGRTFGYPQVSEGARQLEDALADLARAPQDAGAVERFDALLDELERIASRVAHRSQSSPDARSEGGVGRPGRGRDA